MVGARLEGHRLPDREDRGTAGGGYALEEIDNDITGKTPASFEPTIDYVVVKWPRFAFEKFPGADGQLHTSMQSVGEAMAIGRTFKQAFMKAMRSRELDVDAAVDDDLLKRLEIPSHDRYELILEAIRRGHSEGELCERTGIDPWFLAEIAALARGEDPEEGFERTFKAVDTCAAEFEAETPYYYSGWERRAAHEVAPRRPGRSVVILGSGPNRIGQGIEFDYCCVHAAMTVRESGRDAVMINCNPETVSTDYDTSRPPLLRAAHAGRRARRDRGRAARGRDRPVRRPDAAQAGGRAGRGRRAAARHAGRLDRPRRGPAGFSALLDELGMKSPPFATARRTRRRSTVADEVGFPLLVRPSYVLGGRAMEICYRPGARATTSSARGGAGRTIFLDRFLENAIEIDVDALCDGETSTSARSCSTSRRPASTPATPPA